MPAAYSADIRGRVIASVESGSSRRDAAEEFDVSPSSAIKWVATYRATGSWAAKPRGGSTSALEKHANFLLTLIERQSDLTLDEVVCVLRKQGIRSSRTSVWRFFKRHNITFKKTLHAAEQQRADVARVSDARTHESIFLVGEGAHALHGYYHPERDSSLHANQSPSHANRVSGSLLPAAPGNGFCRQRPKAQKCV